MTKKRLQRAKTISFRARQTYITPKYFFWWRCRVPPPSPIHLLHIAFIAIVDKQRG